MYLLLNMVSFHCHVSLPECMCFRCCLTSTAVTIVISKAATPSAHGKGCDKRVILKDEEILHRLGC